jgi:hypothetical protein
MAFRKACAASVLALACAPVVASAQHVYFSDNFDAGTSESRYDRYSLDLSGADPHDVDWNFAFNYGAYEYVRWDESFMDVWAPIPSAPNSVGGTTIGLYMASNLVGSGGEQRSVINFYPKLNEYVGGLPSGDHRLQFDVWINYNGRFEGGAGSTEWFIAGINQEGGGIGGPWIPETVPPADARKGFAMAVAGERGSGIDYRFYRDQSRFTGTTGATPFADAGWIAQSEVVDGSTFGPANGKNSFYQNLFPWPQAETPGSPGKQWVVVEMEYIDDIVYHKMNGTIITARTDTTSTSGHILLGYGDFHASSVAAWEQHPTQGLINANFAVFDNILVTSATEPRPTWNVDADGNWASISNWLNANPENGVLQEVPNHVMHVADFRGGISGNRTVTIDAPHTVRSIVFDNADYSYTVAGPGTITLEALTGAILTTMKVNAGQHTISAPIELQRNTVVNVGPANGMLTLSGPLTTNGRTITKSGAGTLTLGALNADMRIAANQGTVRLAAGSGTATIVPETIGIAPGAALDLTNNGLVVQGGDLGAVNALVAAGYAGGSWTGSGINSSSAAAAGDRSLGIGQEGSDVLVKFTYSGDATLDGAVTIADLGVLAANWQGTDKYWFEGDFNYDGSVNIADLGILAGNWQKGTGGGMSFEEALAMFDVFDGVVIPEPSALGLIGLGMLALRRRRGRG